MGAIEEDFKRWEAETNAAIDELEKKDHTQFSPKERAYQFEQIRRGTRERWIPLTRKDEVGLWTDDYSPIIPILRGEWRFWQRSDE